MPKDTLEDRVKKLEMKIVEIETEQKQVYALIERTIDQIVGSPAFESWMASQGRQGEIRELETRMATIEEEKKTGELKSAIEHLKSQISNQTGSKDIGVKDLFEMVKLDEKKKINMAELVEKIYAEKMAMKMVNEMFGEDKEKNKPNIVEQIKELKDTTDAFKASGLLKDESNVEAARELIENIINTIEPTAKEFIKNKEKKISKKK